VRHAERADDPTAGAPPEGRMLAEDPPLSPAGEERARLLAHMLGDAGVTAIHTSDYRRTRDTGDPLARRAGVAMRVYDHRDLAGFAAELRGTPGRHLVLGHSNTTPQLVEALGGEPGDPIEDLEYDRLYVVLLEGGRATTMLLRFGAPYRR
jgi:phosphohistidine phosphatase SixA